MTVRDDSGRLTKALSWRAGVVRRARTVLAATQRDLRSSEPAQIVACAILGCFVGAIVDLLRDAVWALHSIDFGLPLGSTLSGATYVPFLRIVFVPAIGGLFLGIWARYSRMRKKAEIVDPIEANALLGGRMSMAASIRLTFSTLVSNAAGASLGMEAGYSQLGSAIYSAIGQYFHLRRNDLRVFVTSGAAAAIAAAFNAPLAGAFYGYELILGSYTPRALAPVSVAALCGALMQRSMTHHQVLFEITGGLAIETRSYFLFGLMGIVAAGIGILTMQLVTWTERVLRYSKLPDWLRPTLGGLVLSMVALFFPQVLGSGHGAIQVHFDNNYAFWVLILMLFAKIAGSAISVGSGFRGGLFSSSLFLGCLFGAAFVQGLGYFVPEILQENSAFMLVGMGSVAAAIVGAPMTMVFLVLEATGDFPVTAGVLVGVLFAATIVRLTFGYSFATWRFHLRGLGIRSPHDVGWITDMTVGRLMRSDPKRVRDNISLKALRAKWPVGSAKRLFVMDGGGRYVGVVDVALAHEAEIDDAVDWLVAGDLAEQRDVFLLPFDNVRTALVRFDEKQTESIVVVESRAEPLIVGYMTEAYALKRYTQELERRRSAELGEQDMFSLDATPRS